MKTLSRVSWLLPFLPMFGFAAWGQEPDTCLPGATAAFGFAYKANSSENDSNQLTPSVYRVTEQGDQIRHYVDGLKPRFRHFEVTMGAAGMSGEACQVASFSYPAPEYL